MWLEWAETDESGKWKIRIKDTAVTQENSNKDQNQNSCNRDGGK